MTLCPVAIAVGCKKCPIYNVCPAKGLIGDVQSDRSADVEPMERDKDAANKSD